LAAKRMIERSLERFDLYPSRLLGDSGHGSAEMLGWLVYEHGIEPHITVFDQSARADGTFSREDFTYDHAGDVYRCPGGKILTTTGALVNDGATLLYVASKRDCDRCALKSRCCPKQASRKVPRSICEGARDMARQIARSWEGSTSRRLRKKIETWPRWTPTQAMIAREPARYAKWAGGMEGGEGNPLGARALYLFKGGNDTRYRIHGTTKPQSIGHAVSSGCIRMMNQDIIDLYNRVPLGAKVVVL
jgi:L,D-transpeptidase catalytic domain